MTGRAARLAAAVAGLSWAAAALAALAPHLPPGLASACAPGLVAREVLAGLAVVALLFAPALVADEPGRPREDHTALLALLPAAPAVVALLAAGGGSPSALLPAGALLLSCDLAASSWLRLDPGGGRAAPGAAVAVALLAGIPVAAYGLAEFAGWEGAAAAFRFSPLLAIRDLAGGWGAVGPAALLLVAVAAVLRFAGLGRGTGAAALALAAAVPLAAPAARAEGEGSATVLVVGAPREGDYAALVSGLRARGRSVVEVDALPPSFPWATEVLVFARQPRTPGEADAWRARSRAFAWAGGGVVPWPGEPVESPAGALGRVLAAAGAPATPDSPCSVPHPAARPEPGVNPELFRVPFPAPPASLPGKTLAFLAVLAASFAGAALLVRRRGLGQAGAAAALAGVAAVGTGLLFLPGVLGDPFRVDRLVVEERLAGSPSARRVEVLRVERLRPGGEGPVVGREPGVSWAEIRYAADAEPAWRPDGTVHLEAPGRYALLAGVSGVESPAPAEPFLARAVSIGGGQPQALADWRRNEDPRVARAGWLLAALVRAPGRHHQREVLFAVPAAGPDAVVIHSR